MPIDVVGGTSMGAIIGALHAMALGRPEMIEMNNKMWRKIRPFHSYTVPIVSLFGHRKFDECGPRNFFSVKVFRMELEADFKRLFGVVF